MCLAAGAAVFGACEAPARQPATDPDPATPRRADAANPWAAFDPDTVQPGTRAGGLVLDTLHSRDVASGYDADVAVFGGEIELSGRTMIHPDADIARETICFEADSVAGRLLPYMEGDRRRRWFCFEDQAVTAGMLAVPGEVTPATIVIDGYTIIFGSSDEVNRARLVRVLSRGADGGTGAGAADSAADAAREQAVRAIVAFLRGESELDPRLLADTVELHVAPEGGGESRRIARQALLDRDAWRIGERSLLPPEIPARLSTMPGQHVNCRVYSLESRDPALARLPHVGASLQQAPAGSCLQTWNMTFIFAAAPGHPILVAVLYDQWEW